MTFELLSGVLLTLDAVAALLFFRAFVRTSDRLFVYFGAAFATLSLERLLLAFTERSDVNEPLAYIPRIVAFGIILWAIYDRNRR